MSAYIQQDVHSSLSMHDHTFWLTYPIATWRTICRYASITSIFLYWNQYFLIWPFQSIEHYTSIL